MNNKEQKKMYEKRNNRDKYRELFINIYEYTRRHIYIYIYLINFIPYLPLKATTRRG